MRDNCLKKYLQAHTTLNTKKLVGQTSRRKNVTIVEGSAILLAHAKQNKTKFTLYNSRRD